MKQETEAKIRFGGTTPLSYRRLFLTESSLRGILASPQSAVMRCGADGSEDVLETEGDADPAALFGMQKQHDEAQPETKRTTGKPWIGSHALTDVNIMKSGRQRFRELLKCIIGGR